MSGVLCQDQENLSVERPPSATPQRQEILVGYICRHNVNLIKESLRITHNPAQGHSNLKTRGARPQEDEDLAL